jgi:hypothetical protein
MPIQRSCLAVLSRHTDRKIDFRVQGWVQPGEQGNRERIQHAGAALPVMRNVERNPPISCREGAKTGEMIFFEKVWARTNSVGWLTVGLSRESVCFTGLPWQGRSRIGPEPCRDSPRFRASPRLKNRCRPRRDGIRGTRGTLLRIRQLASRQTWLELMNCKAPIKIMKIRLVIPFHTRYYFALLCLCRPGSTWASGNESPNIGLPLLDCS